MNTFAGSITFDWKINTDSLPFQYVLTKVGSRKVIYVHGETLLGTSKEIADLISDAISGKILSHDISVETEDQIILLSAKQTDGKYHFMAFHGLSFQEVMDRIDTLTGEIIAVREAEESDKLGGRVVKVDILSE